MLTDHDVCRGGRVEKGLCYLDRVDELIYVKLVELDYCVATLYYFFRGYSPNLCLEMTARFYYYVNFENIIYWLRTAIKKTINTIPLLLL